MAYLMTLSERMSLDSVRVLRKKYMVMSSTGSRIKYNYADEDQQKFTQPDAISISDNIGQNGRMAGE
jgi:hypothetical protein